MRPWRCEDCKLRFYGWTTPLKFVLHVHCHRCGNVDLQRIAKEFGEGDLRLLWRVLHLPAYRCAPCRKRFFSILPRLHHRSYEAEPVRDKRVARQ
jgi:hypothetical protein